jgi:hypothetical protein
MADRTRLSLPGRWPDHVMSGNLQAISLASFAIAFARGRTKTQRRLRADL